MVTQIVVIVTRHLTPLSWEGRIGFHRDRSVGINGRTYEKIRFPFPWPLREELPTDLNDPQGPDG